MGYRDVDYNEMKGCNQGYVKWRAVIRDM